MELSNRGGHVSVPKMITAKTCNLSKDYLFIDYKGNVILCCNDYLSSTVFGNLAKEQIIDIWKKKEYRFIRYSTKQGLFLLEICKRCMGLSNPYQPPAKPRQGEQIISK